MDASHKHPPYLLIWGALFLLTVVEVTLVYLRFERHVLVTALIVLAVWKALLVALYFMHLRFEPKRLALVALAPLPLGFILVMAVLQEYAKR